jgi:tetratricopeptide (TPR) repeat protein
MRIKYLFFLIAILLSGLKSNVLAEKRLLTDTLAASKRHIKLVKIGPQELYLAPLIPPVDSAAIRETARLARLAKIASDEKAIKEAIDAGFSKIKEDLSLKNYQNTHLLLSLLDNMETSGTADENIIATLDKALEAYRKVRDIKSQSLIMNTYAVYYGKKGELDKSILYFREAICLKELIKDKNGIISISNTLSAIYKILGNYDEAIASNEYLIKVYKSLNNQSQVAKLYVNIASLKGLQRKYDESEYYIMKRALPLFQRPLNQNGRMNCFVNLADMYQLKNRNSEAKWYYLAAIFISKLLVDKKMQVYCLVNLAQVKNAIGDYDLALSDYKEAEQLSVENGYKDMLVKIKADMGETYRKMGNYAAAGNALNEYTQLKSILLSTGN